MGKSLSTGAKGLLFAGAAALIWTSFILLSRLATRTVFNPFDLAFLRFCGALIVVLLMLTLRPRKSDGTAHFANVTWARSFVLAMLGGAGFTALAFIGFTLTPAAHASVLMPGTLPFSAAILAWMILGDPITKRKGLGLLAIVCGVALVAAHALAEAPGAGNQYTWVGDLAFPLASVVWALFTIYTRKWKIGAVDATIVVCLICFVFYIPAYLLWAPKKLMLAPLGAIVVTCFFQGAIALVGSMWVFTRAVAALGPSKTTMITSVVPALSAVLAVPLLGEPLSVYLVFGVLAVTAGMLIGITGTPLRPTPTTA